MSLFKKGFSFLVDEDISQRSELHHNGQKSATECYVPTSELPESQASGKDESSTSSSLAESGKSKAEATGITISSSLPEGKKSKAEPQKQSSRKVIFEGKVETNAKSVFH